MKKSLKINTLAGILDILGSIIYFFAVFIIFAGAFGSEDGSGASMAANVMLMYAVVCLVIHIVGLIKSKKEGMKTTGHILGIIGHGIYAVAGALVGGLPGMILCILSAVFTLKNNKKIVETN